MNDVKKGVVSTLAFGGEGVIRDDNFVVFVPFSAKNEEVSFRITEKKKDFARGRIAEVLKASPDRIEPRCSHFGICGGCQLQHLNAEAQSSFKQQTVKEALQRIGGEKADLKVDFTPSKHPWEYRRHISLRFKREQDVVHLGYSAYFDASFMPVVECPIFSFAAEKIFQEAKKILTLLFKKEEEGKVAFYKEENGTLVLSIFVNKVDRKAWDKVVNQEVHFFHSIVVTTPSNRFFSGMSELNFEVDGLSFQYSPLAFVQTHPEQSAAIYKTLVEWVTELSPKKMLDLYCGLGVTSLLLAKRGVKVRGIDLNREGIELAKKNTENNNILGAAFSVANVEHVLKSELAKTKPDVVAVNPPRAGLNQTVVDQINKSDVKHLFYTSCMPPTLARDIKRLKTSGFVVKRCHAFDMFPQTFHVETLVELERSS